MGFTGTGRFRQLAISRQRTWFDLKKYETPNDRPTSGSFGNDTPRETLSDWERLDYRDERGLDET